MPPERILRTNLCSREPSKLTANGFLAQRISSFNSTASPSSAKPPAPMCMKLVVPSAATHAGSKFLQAGPGFGGSCFQKDILNLVYLCHHDGLLKVAAYWEQVVQLNTWQQHRIARRVVNRLFGTVSGKRIVVLGLGFKAHTKDIRRTPAIPA